MSDPVIDWHLCFAPMAADPLSLSFGQPISKSSQLQAGSVVRAPSPAPSPAGAAALGAVPPAPGVHADLERVLDHLEPSVGSRWCGHLCNGCIT